MNETNPLVKFGAKASSPTVQLPVDRDLETFSEPTYSYKVQWPLKINMQGFLGICTAEAVKQRVEYLYFIKTGKYVQLSAAFLYIVGKLFVDKNKDEGSSAFTMLTAAMTIGVCTEETFPTDYNLDYASFINQQIPQSAWAEAANYKINTIIPISVDKFLLQAAIAKYGPVIVRFEVGKEWYTAPDGSSSWEAKDILPLRPPAEVIDGHLCLADAYVNDSVGTFENPNSWSEKWAEPNVGRGVFHFSTYKPTEMWVATLDSAPDNSPKIEFKEVQELMNILRQTGVIPQ